MIKKKQEFKFPKEANRIDKRPLSEVIKNGNVNEISLYILRNLIKNDNQAIIKWLRTVLLIDPNEKIHSIEGVFSIKRDNGGFLLLGPKLTSWDGLETSSEWSDELKKLNGAIDIIGFSIIKHISQKMMLRPLAMSKFITQIFPNEEKLQSKKTHPGDIVKVLNENQIFLENQNDTIVVINSMLEKADLNKEIIDSIIEHIVPSYMSTFTIERTGPKMMGELFKSLSHGDPATIQSKHNWKSIFQLHRLINYHGVGNENNHTIDCEVWQQNIGKNKLIYISINGFTLGYWLENGKLKNINDIKEIKSESKKLSELLKTPIVDAVFGNLHEGD